jgi:hypothetical protein
MVVVEEDISMDILERRQVSGLVKKTGEVIDGREKSNYIYHRIAYSAHEQGVANTSALVE